MNVVQGNGFYALLHKFILMSSFIAITATPLLVCFFIHNNTKILSQTVIQAVWMVGSMGDFKIGKLFFHIGSSL